MLVQRQVAVFGLLAAQCLGSHVIHEKRHETPKTWMKGTRLDLNDIFNVRIGLAQSNLDSSHELLMDVSDPNSPNYGKFWTGQKVIDTFAPSNDTVSTVQNWLEGSGIESSRIIVSKNKAWMMFNATVSEAEQLFHAEYYEFENLERGATTVACDEYKIPASLRSLIDYVTPGILLGESTKRRALQSRSPSGPIGASKPAILKPGQFFSKSNPLSTCDGVVTPDCIVALYDLPPASKAHPGNAIGIFERGDFWDQTSLDLYFTNFTHIPNGTQPLVNDIDIPSLPVGFGNEAGEAEMDIQLAFSLVYPQNVTVWQVDDVYYSGYWWQAGKGLFNTFLDAIDGSYCNYSAFGETGDDPNLDPIYPDNNTIGGIPGTGANNYKGQRQCGVFEPTNVISFSYGAPESAYPDYYMKRQCNEFLKLGLQGITVISSSGDHGVGESLGCLGENETIFSPSYPSNCPYITAVGATMVSPNRTVRDPESAVWESFPYPFNGTNNAYTSGGGFSNTFSAPNYQTSTVDGYFQHHNPPYPSYVYNGSASSVGANGGIFNRAGRGVPDVAANGLNIPVVVNGHFSLSGGTSASAPIFASIINRINEERLAIGKKTVGFINPVLYQFPWILNDITNGTNPNCNTEGFEAVAGWDPVTGLGTPNYPKMVELFLALP